VRWEVGAGMPEIMKTTGPICGTCRLTRRKSELGSRPTLGDTLPTHQRTSGYGLSNCIIKGSLAKHRSGRPRKSTNYSKLQRAAQLSTSIRTVAPRNSTEEDHKKSKTRSQKGIEWTTGANILEEQNAKLIARSRRTRPIRYGEGNDGSPSA